MEVFQTLGAGLLYVGLATLVTGSIGMLAAKQLARLVGYSVLVSTGLLLAALGLRIEALTTPVLFYLIVSVLTTSIFFMLTGMTDRTRVTNPPVSPDDDAVPQPLYVAYGIKAPSVHAGDADVGIVIPGTMAFLGMAFFCSVLLVAGLPPLPGFLAKFALLSTALGASPASIPASTWVLCAAVLSSGLAGMVALSRVGIRLFWTVTARTTPRLRLVEAIPIAVLVLLTLGLSVAVAPVTRYLESAAQSLHQPDNYVRAVLSQQTGRERAEAGEP